MSRFRNGDIIEHEDGSIYIVTNVHGNQFNANVIMEMAEYVPKDHTVLPFVDEDHSPQLKLVGHADGFDD